MSLGNRSLAIVYPSGAVRQSEEDKSNRIRSLEEIGFSVTRLEPQHASENGYTAGTTVERAAMLAHALTQRRYDILWVARGGFGGTSLLPFLENMLPPAIPDKTFVGFSDASFLGVYLSLKYPNLTYVHGNHAHSSDLFSGSKLDRDLLFSILASENIPTVPFPVEASVVAQDLPNVISGPCIPLNLSLAESLAAVRHVELPAKNILFLEDVNEDLYRILRKFDSLVNSGFLENTQAIVLGSFTSCPNSEGVNITEDFLAKLVAKSCRKPVFVLPLFGHGRGRLPLVSLSETNIIRRGSIYFIDLSFRRLASSRMTTQFPSKLFAPSAKLENELPKAHFVGIGGTGMAACAGLFKSAGFTLTGSDNPIYPPMDEVLKELEINPSVGYSAENIDRSNPDFIVLSNVISRISADLHPNLELEHLLDQNIPVLSFPASLRKYFLHDSFNIVVTGTHGKTTTTSMIAHVLDKLGKSPSFLIGGAPKNFNKGFCLQSRELFVLEGDEYDTAFFDKGPKFLHYEPRISIINNIEFDHADIYASIEDIEKEFTRLAFLTKERGGLIVANLSDPRVVRVCQKSGATTLGFAHSDSSPPPFPCWRLEKHETLVDGSSITVRSPGGHKFGLKAQVFGKHNALNLVASLAALQAYSILNSPSFEFTRDAFEHKISQLDENLISRLVDSISTFSGVRRRFDLVAVQQDIAIFDDFAHHPTAINTTLEAFRAYMTAANRRGRLIACFDPRNATMRRRVLQSELAQSFHHADLVFFGRVPEDKRLATDEVLDGPGVAAACGAKARYFPNNQDLCEHLKEILRPSDTIVFMSSGSFDGLPRKLANRLETSAGV